MNIFSEGLKMNITTRNLTPTDFAVEVIGVTLDDVHKEGVQRRFMVKASSFTL